MNRPTTSLAGTALFAALLAASACTTTSDVAGGLLGSNERSVRPGDFVEPASQATPVAEGPAASQAAPLEPATELPTDTTDTSRSAPPAQAAATAPSPRIDPDDPLPIDGMIGQINGRPVYANDVLADLADSLRAKGRQLARAEFEKQAEAEITEAIRATLQSRLILAEAERSLTENEWNGVRFMREERRNELLRMHGLGSLKATDRVLREDTGRGLDETLQRFQEGIITRTYVNRNLMALINVSRRDIERYYRENLARFQPEPIRDLTIIVTDSRDVAGEIESQLGQGTPFSELAAGPMNQLANDGRMQSIRGDHPFGRAEIETPMLAAAEGEWFGPIEVQDGRLWFVRVDRVELGEQLSLEDAQASIEATLREQQRSLRTQQFIERLRREGNFTDPAEMVKSLTRIAVSRYARP